LPHPDRARTAGEVSLSAFQPVAAYTNDRTRQSDWERA
jgi:hypothetical protein